MKKIHSMHNEFFRDKMWSLIKITRLPPSLTVPMWSESIISLIKITFPLTAVPIKINVRSEITISLTRAPTWIHAWSEITRLTSSNTPSGCEIIARRALRWKSTAKHKTPRRLRTLSKWNSRPTIPTVYPSRREVEFPPQAPEHIWVNGRGSPSPPLVTRSTSFVLFSSS